MSERERASQRFCIYDKMRRISGRKTFHTTDEEVDRRKKKLTKRNTQQYNTTQIKRRQMIKPNRTKIKR